MDVTTRKTAMKALPCLVVCATVALGSLAAASITQDDKSPNYFVGLDRLELCPP